MKTAGIDIGATRLRTSMFDEDCRLVSSMKTIDDQRRGREENMKPVIAYFRAAFRDDTGLIGAALLI